MKRQVSKGNVIEDVASEKSSVSKERNKNTDEGSYGINKEDKQYQSDAQSSGKYKQSFKLALQDRKYLKAISDVRLPGNKKRNSRKVKQRKSRFGSKC
jgi:hypothetical protein